MAITQDFKLTATLEKKSVAGCMRGLTWSGNVANLSRTSHVHVPCLTPKNYHGYLLSTKNDTLKANKENAITSVSRDWVPRLLDTNNDYSKIMICLIFGRVHETTSETNREHWNRIVHETWITVIVCLTIIQYAQALWLCALTSYPIFTG